MYIYICTCALLYLQLTTLSPVHGMLTDPITQPFLVVESRTLVGLMLWAFACLSPAHRKPGEFVWVPGMGP